MVEILARGPPEGWSAAEYRLTGRRGGPKNQAWIPPGLDPRTAIAAALGKPVDAVVLKARDGDAQETSAEPVEPPEPPAEPPPHSDPPEASVEKQPSDAEGVSFTITKAQKQRLRELGYTDAQIREMTPAEAHAIVAADPSDLHPLPARHPAKPPWSVPPPTEFSLETPSRRCTWHLVDPRTDRRTKPLNFAAMLRDDPDEGRLLTAADLGFAPDEPLRWLTGLLLPRGIMSAQASERVYTQPL